MVLFKLIWKIDTDILIQQVQRLALVGTCSDTWLTSHKTLFHQVCCVLSVLFLIKTIQTLLKHCQMIWNVVKCGVALILQTVCKNWYLQQAFIILLSECVVVALRGSTMHGKGIGSIIIPLTQNTLKSAYIWMLQTLISLCSPVVHFIVSEFFQSSIFCFLLLRLCFVLTSSPLCHRFNWFSRCSLSVRCRVGTLSDTVSVLCPPSDCALCRCTLSDRDVMERLTGISAQIFLCRVLAQTSNKGDVTRLFQLSENTT